MSTRKHVRFAAPYRSKTFNDTNAFIFGRNGVVSGGEVTTSGPTVTIQPIVFVQNGLLIDVDIPLSTNTPADLTAPYFAAVSVSSSIENLSETITPTFIKRPQDITPTTTLVAEWDGTQWIPLPKLQLFERSAEEALRSKELGFIGVARGLDCTQDISSITVQAGSLIDRTGRLVVRPNEETLQKISDPFGSNFYRVDSIVYRRPADNPARAGTLKLVKGATFVWDQDNVFTSPNTVTTDAGGVAQTKVLRSGANTAIFSRSGTAIVMAVYDDTFTQILAPTTVALAVDQFSACANPDGSFDLVYTRTSTLYYKRVDATGGDVYTELTVSTGGGNLYDPAIITLGPSTGYFIHIAWTHAVGGTEREIMYSRRSSANTEETAPVVWIDLSADLRTPYLEKNEHDNLIYVAFENRDTGRAYLRTYDEGTVTSAQPPDEVASPIELQNEVYNLDTSTLMPSTGAREPVVLLGDNMELFVLWRHLKSGSDYGIAAYSPRYSEELGYKAVIVRDDIVDSFSAVIDGFNRAIILQVVGGGTDVEKTALNLEVGEEYGVTGTAITGTGLNSPALAIGETGELFSVASDATDLLQWYSTSGVEIAPRDRALTRADVYVAAYRAPDGALAVSGTVVEEDLAVKRLYELQTVMAATGTVSWQIAAPNTLVILSNISLRFFNRDSTYTILANGPGGIVVPNNHAVTVEIPDEDSNATLALNIVPFGEGILDRAGRRTVVLFWNITGVLYTKFAPFRLSSDGETIIIGDQLSQEMLTWLGASDSTPDPSNHGYGSTFYILESDSLVAAIGKLDAAAGAGETGIANLALGATAISVVFGAPRPNANYRLAHSMQNTVDAAPMIMPTITTAKSTTGFTVTWPSALDTANYRLEFIARDA